MPRDSTKPKKFPACDRCKHKRVLCHPTAPGSGLSCPRCTELGVACTTTPVVRRKPVRKSNSNSEEPAPPEAPTLPLASSELPIASTSSTPYELALVAASYGLAPPEHFSIDTLSPSLLRTLIERDFQRLPQLQHPIIVPPINALNAALRRTAWVPSLLPPSTRAFAACVVALTALQSIDPAILGPGPVPASFEELGSRGSVDWASFGLRRERACRSLRREAFKAAMASDVLLVATEENAATCCMLDILDLGFGDFPTSRSRPWSGAYLSHVQVLASAQEEDQGMRDDKVRWSSYLMEECMRSLYSSTPINFSPEQELLLRGSDVPSLDETLKLLEERPLGEKQIVFEVVRAYSVGTTSLARRIRAGVTGAYAKGRPLDHATTMALIDDLDTLGAVEQATLRRIEHIRPPVASNLFPPLSISAGRTHMTNPDVFAYVLDLIGHLMCMGHSAVVLELHVDLQRRAKPLPPVSSPVEARAREREDVLRKQLADMAVTAARTVGRGLERLPCLSHITHFRCIRIARFASILLDDASAMGGLLTPENARALQS
ncbi:hypothetical protein BCR35DRAFT_299868 [Leucosporidium creatinivorum]|uniref:Zn(2)-C6 fungal-type domain-containing protein n=1 Tax=Leucosporidium creatinivorum TaxID=106004 RepID=A0A1Y2G2K3_9BASI|nr:hypothetical protein BCR35DRAFT_299868 [Leucosporidium creatinivorum]